MAVWAAIVEHQCVHSGSRSCNAADWPCKYTGEKRSFQYFVSHLQPPFVHFVDDHVRHRCQLRIDHQATDEDAGRTERQACDPAGLSVGVDGVAHHPPDVFATLLGDTVRQSCKSAHASLKMDSSVGAASLKVARITDAPFELNVY